MRMMFTVVNSLIASIITTLIILTVCFLIMLFSSAEDGYRTTFFGGIFFSSKEALDGSTSLSFGLENPIPIYIAIAIFFVVFLTLFHFSKKRVAM